VSATPPPSRGASVTRSCVSQRKVGPHGDADPPRRQQACRRHIQGFEIATDQPVRAAARAAPRPVRPLPGLDRHLRGFYVLDFCATRDIPTAGIQVLQSWERDATRTSSPTIRQEIVLPAAFPEKYEQAVVRAANQCAVKKHLEHPPHIEIHVARHGAETPRACLPSYS